MGAESIELTYVLDDLPSAQHKAGLAGLALVVDSLKSRGKASLPKLLELTPGILRLRVSQQSLQTVFDDLYDATTENVPRTKKRKGHSTVQGGGFEQLNSATGRGRLVNEDVYEQVRPKGEFLRQIGLPAAWLKLWRDAVWRTLRGIDKTRGAYRQRAARKPTELAPRVWDDLRSGRGFDGKRRRRSVEVAGPLFIGAQARTAEGVPFHGSPHHVLLLHFWPAVTTCWVPEVLRMRRDGRELHTVREQVGYVFAVPEVADLEDFVETFPQVLAELPAEVAGFHPRYALIALPEEGALELLRQVSEIVRARAGREVTARSVHAVEVYHLQKRGNTIPILHSARVPMDRGMLERYERVRELRHPILKAQLVRNVLRRASWYEGFGSVLSVHPTELFFERDFVDGVAGRFADDARRQAREVT